MGRRSRAEKEFSTARKLVDELADAAPDGELSNNFRLRAQNALRSSSQHMAEIPGLRCGAPPAHQETASRFASKRKDIERKE
jgi:hypothetical protein